MDLKKLRQQVDNIDTQIIKLINKRTEVALKIGKMKNRKQMEIYSPERERDVYRRLIRENKGPLSDNTIRAIYREIMSGALSVEKDLRIAYLGPSASFTHQAARKKFGASVQYVPTDSITGVFYEVSKGKADDGVVPIENSIEGAVTHTLDMFIDSDLKICSEIYLDIHHHLLARCSLSQIRKVYSNPLVFGQCRAWVRENLSHVELVEVYSTTRAAELAAREKYVGAIASELAAGQYGLRILKRSIEGSVRNVTRFLVIGKRIGKKTRHSKTSMMFAIKDRVGALYETLAPFYLNRINMTKIESRPSRKRAWEYYFFVDFIGHCEERRVKKALKELEASCIFIKILGSYPVEELK